MPYVRWTTEQDRQLLTLADKGISEERIASKMDRSVNGVRIRFERLVGRRSMTNEKLVPHDARPISHRLAKDALKQLDARPPEKRKEPKAGKKDAPPSAFAKWTPEDDTRLKEMSRRGDAVKAMAKALGRTERAIYFRITQLSEQRVIAPDHKHRLKSTRSSSSSVADESSKRSHSETGRSTRCAICRERSVGCALVPCGHTFCLDCSKFFRSCPNCRSPITQVMKIFLA